MKQEVLIGQQDYTVLILIRDTAGAAKTGLTNGSAGLDVSYVRVETDNDVVVTACAPVALATPALTDPHLDWGFLEVDATNHPGLYRLDIADGVFASGAWSAVVTLIGTGLDPTHIEFVLIAFNPRDAVRLGLTALPNAAADAAGGVPISDAGGLDLDAIKAMTDKIGTVVNSGGTATIGAVLGDFANSALVTRLGAPSDLGSGASLAKNLVDIEGQTDDIGVAGAGLTAVPWNAAWDAEVQSECDDAVTANASVVAILADTNELQTDDYPTSIAAVKSDTAAILTDTGTTLDGKADQLVAACITNAAGADIAADIIAIKAETAAIVADTNELQTDDYPTSIAAVKADTAAILTDTGTDGVAVAAGAIAATSFAAGAIDAAALAANAVDEIVDEVMEGTITLRQAVRLLLAVLTAKSSGGGTATIVFRDIGDTKNRISATVDADGNRTAIGTRDGT